MSVHGRAAPFSLSQLNRTHRAHPDALATLKTFIAVDPNVNLLAIEICFQARYNEADLIVRKEGNFVETFARRYFGRPSAVDTIIVDDLHFELHPKAASHIKL